MTLTERLQKIDEASAALHEHFAAFTQDLATAQDNAARLDEVQTKVLELDALQKSLSGQVQDLEARRNAAIQALADLKGRL
jgi:DNA repair ATPase RecN